MDGDNTKRRFKNSPSGYFHIDIAEIRTEDGTLSMVVAIGRVTKVAFGLSHGQDSRRGWVPLGAFRARADRSHSARLSKAARAIDAIGGTISEMNAIATGEVADNVE